MISLILKQTASILKRRIVRSHQVNCLWPSHGPQALLLAAITLGLGYLLAPRFAYVIGLYFLINMAYSKWLKHIPIIDVLDYLSRLCSSRVELVLRSFKWNDSRRGCM